VSSNFAPSPTPTATTPVAPSPSPSPSDDEVKLLSVEPNPWGIAPGAYGTSFQPQVRPEDTLGLRTIRVVVNLNQDGTYSIQGYITLHGTDVNDRLYREEKGRYLQTPDRLLWRDRIVRQLNFDNDTWIPWAVPDRRPSGEDAIRNVTPSSFELSLSNNWQTLRRLY
jgi:hypothetical protein